MDLKTARQATSVNIPLVREYLHNGLQAWERRERIVRTMSSDPAFDKTRRSFMSREELFDRALAMTKRVYELEDHLGWSAKDTELAVSLLDDGTPITLHDVAFEPVIRSQAPDSLLERYAALARHHGIIGCYLQTELGHGSNVAGLETTATFIPGTQEFEIHSPTLTSTKWWIGALGKMATHGVVQAQLILPGGKNAGPHLFFVQLRSTGNHTVLPGIHIGDIGPKALGGWATIDNGFARFDRVRIPRENMLSKFAEVTADGDYIKPPHSKINYGGMLYIRSTMITSAGWALAKAATVSLRYSTVRRQGGKHHDGSEKQIIDYPSVHYRLLPILARAFVFIQLGRHMTQAFAETSARLAAGDTSSLAEMHAITSGLKVLVTTAGARDIEVARRSMGGHGFSAFAGLGRLYAQYLPSATFEGDNFVLDEQVVRAAMKAYQALRPSSELSPSTRYLRLLIRQEPVPPVAAIFVSARPADLALLLEHRAARAVAAHAARILEGGLDASATQRVSNAVTEAMVASQVTAMIEGLQTSPLPVCDRKVVEKVYVLYLLTSIEMALVDFLSFGLLPATTQKSDPVGLLRAQIAKICRELVPEAIGLTDAFGFSDWELDSALGVYDGRVYEALWEKTKGEPLNEVEVTPGYDRYIKPILERGRRKALGKTRL